MQPLGRRRRIVALQGQEPQAIQGLAVVRFGLDDAAVPVFRLPPVPRFEAATGLQKFLHGSNLFRISDFEFWILLAAYVQPGKRPALEVCFPKGYDPLAPHVGGMLAGGRLAASSMSA